jgi:hypothetical protein
MLVTKTRILQMLASRLKQHYKLTVRLKGRNMLVARIRIRQMLVARLMSCIVVRLRRLDMQVGKKEPGKC